ncbi:phosphoribosylanthranilate isomerase [Halotalea alkalilenta]|uniref:N-(5'-phosphoribosyl)anthranilate isomerase n=1 Tax=Halotalea alkalilenta TaxID=376489 RepID=A0A172YF23_9GAMM|nr:phosphoribosylanthranilate isomerase [Halotalea alkalilenta]ANF57797.1 N-(5'-phosphoribosyl)anthranilate isomerase [Halotalea alkalilenta]
MRTRIKFCGLTREDDVDAAVEAGADALGFVLWPGSKRAVTLERLEALSARVPPFVARVGLFVDQDAEVIAAAAPCLDLLQFHGDEPPQACAGFGTPWLKALRMREGLDLDAAAQRYAGARGLLLDAWRPGVPGGTGETFDWARIPAWLASRIVLAGGLDAGNVAEAITRVRPYAVDVSGGIEAAPGRKDHERMAAFAAAVRMADRSD